MSMPMIFTTNLPWIGFERINSFLFIKSNGGGSGIKAQEECHNQNQLTFYPLLISSYLFVA